MGNILAFVSVKGGVGKTTLALETASSLANDFGKRVLLVDGNFSAPNIGLYLDLTNELNLQDVLIDGRKLHLSIYESNGFDVIPGSLFYDGEADVFKLKKILEKIKNRYDFIILDSSPHYSEMIPIIAAADKVFVVTTADDVTLATSMKAAIISRKNKTPIEGIIVNKIKNPDFELTLKQIEEYSGMPVFAKIHDHKKISEARFYRRPITVHAPRNSVSREISRFSSALCGVSEKNNFLSYLLPVSFRRVLGREKVNRELIRKNFYVSPFR